MKPIKEYWKFIYLIFKETLMENLIKMYHDILINFKDTESPFSSAYYYILDFAKENNIDTNSLEIFYRWYHNSADREKNGKTLRNIKRVYAWDVQVNCEGPFPHPFLEPEIYGEIKSFKGFFFFIYYKIDHQDILIRLQELLNKYNYPLINIEISKSKRKVNFFNCWNFKKIEIILKTGYNKLY
jgi:hypothetical protein